MEVTEALIYMTCLCLARDLVSCDDFEETGKDITLTPSIRGKPTEILWKHNENMVLEYDGSEVVEYEPYRGRLVVDFETGQLTIRKLNSQDSGQYQSEILINGKVQTSSHTVTVLDALPEPQVICELDESSNVKKLLCSVESQTQPSYKWSGPDINNESRPELLVDEQEENRDSVYTCTVKNQANSRSADFTLKDCPTVRAGSTVLVPVLLVTLLLILLILLAIFLYRRKKQKQARLSTKPNKMDPENGEDQNLLKSCPVGVMSGSPDATLPCHNRLPSQRDSIANKKWDQDSGSEKLLKENKKSLEHNLKQSPQSMSEANQEDKEHGNEGELVKNKKNSESAVEAEENTYSKPDETEKEGLKPLQSQEEKEKSQELKQESGNGEKSPEHQNERREEQKTDNNEDNQTRETEEKTDRDSETETASPQSAVTERNNMDTENKEEQRHENEEESQSDNGEPSLEQQNENKQKTEDDMKPGEKNESSEEENHDGIDRANTAEPCNGPAVNDGEAPSAPAANLEKEPIKSSGSSDYPYQDKEEEIECPGLEQDKEETIVTDQEQKDGQEQMSEEKHQNPEKSEEKSSTDFNKQDKQTDPDSTKNSVSQRDEAVKSDMTDKDQSFKPNDDDIKAAEGETEVQTQQEDGGQRDINSEPETRHEAEK